MNRALKNKIQNYNATQGYIKRVVFYCDEVFILDTLSLLTLYE